MSRLLGSIQLSFMKYCTGTAPYGHNRTIIPYEHYCWFLILAEFNLAFSSYTNKSPIFRLYGMTLD